MIPRLHGQIRDLQDLLQRDIWQPNLGELPPRKRGLYSLLRMLYIVIRGFIRDNCSLQASALTFVTLMSMVPLLALSFAVAKGMGGQEKLNELAIAYTAELPEHLLEFRDRLMDLVNNTNFAALGAIGSVLIFYTVIEVMGRIEFCFNTIWGVRTSRTILRKFSDYISVLMVVPVLILFVSSINASMSSESLVAALSARIGPLFIVYEMLLKATGVLGIVGAFTFLYIFLPNTRVYFGSALVAGICGGLMWLGWQWFCINFQVWLTKYNRIYGAFATLPVTLFWLYINWNIILFGAEISFAVQNYRTFSMEGESSESSYTTRKLLAFIMTYDICRRFHLGQQAWQPTQFQERWQIPIRLIRTVLQELKEGHCIIETTNNAFVPARDLSSLTMKDVELAVIGTRDARVQDIAERMRFPVARVLADYQEDNLKTLASRSFRQLLEGRGSGANGETPVPANTPAPADSPTAPVTATAAATAPATPATTP